MDHGHAGSRLEGLSGVEQQHGSTRLLGKVKHPVVPSSTAQQDLCDLKGSLHTRACQVLSCSSIVCLAGGLPDGVAPPPVGPLQFLIACQQSARHAHKLSICCAGRSRCCQVAIMLSPPGLLVRP